MKRRLIVRTHWLIIFIVLFIIDNGCRTKGKPYEPSYTTDALSKKVLLFGVPSQSYFELTDSMVAYLNERLKGVQIKTVASSSFMRYNTQLEGGYFDLTIINGLTALKVIRSGYNIIGQVVEESGNTGSIVVNKDSSIKTFSDLKGKTIATPGTPALPGHMLQVVYLSQHGLNVNKDIKFRYFESFESVFLNVFLGRCSAGFSTTTSWKAFVKGRPEIASKVFQKWQTPPIIGNAILLRSNMNAQIAEQITKLFLLMHTNQQGRNALGKIGFTRFDPADSNSYQSIKDFLEEYNSIIVGSKR